MSFKENTIKSVIEPLIALLKNREGYVYQSLGHFYREIELLKFPYLANAKPGDYYYSSHGRNVYSQQQYESILNYLVEKMIISVHPNPDRNGWKCVLVLSNKDKISSLESTEITQEKQYPPIVPEKSSYQPMGVFGRKAQQEKERKAQAVLDAMSLSMSLDPDVNWVIKFIDGHPFLSVNQ